MLRSSSLCYLGVTLEDGTTHQSLMIFTYVGPERRIILSTRRDSTKFSAISRMKRVTLLVHDLDGQDAAAARLPNKTRAITLKGEVTILADLDTDLGIDSPRSKHLARHGSEYRQFIVGESIAILSVVIESAQISDSNDRVQYWSATEQRDCDALGTTCKQPQPNLTSLPPEVDSAIVLTDLEPPFPDEVNALLLSASSCHLGVTLPDGTSHLCLMIFTYIAEEQRIILSTRRDTAKFRAISQLTRVTLLLHDLNARDAAAARLPASTHSITLYGEVVILADAESEANRSAHLARHGSKYHQFIVGENVAMLSVSVESARICDARDQVRLWSRRDNAVSA
jgi:general stress protein 26